MAFTGSDFDPMDAGESGMLGFDFVNDLASGETISNATWTCEAVEGTDAQAATRLVGSPQNTGTLTKQRVAGLVAGVRYLLQATVTTSAGNTLSLWSRVLCVNPG